MDKYLIHYFSGTGNTYHMVKVIEKELKNNGYEVHLLNIEKNNNNDLVKFKLHIFCYPIYGFGTPAIVLKYISNLQAVSGCKAVIICSCAGFEGQSLYHLRFLLKKKGFDVFLTDFVVHTYNWTQVFNPQDEKTEENVFAKADIKTVELVQKISKNKNYLKKRNAVNLLWSWIIFTIYSKVAHRILGKTFIADSSCTNCGKCKSICPVKAIDMKNGRPNWNWNCETCQRCINICPCKSIQLSVVKLCMFILSELAPIFIIIHINKYRHDLSTVLDILIYCIMFIISTLLANKLIWTMEKVPLLRGILEFSYTKKYRRNMEKDFKRRL